ncbi:dehydrogenase of unknown specificity, short-chain alcohol dehydrogenase like [Frankia sp. EI5c]|uniref:SDR family NAD(P)-dependent oxidoreductase n=1 Tax=Frankia sp. EI5c TaxID=683316 RepID=UPI0007C24DC7|nr:SDR family NAD(P)-dependent oxidoreductase [Frankia sp. EI5c]OAA19788.1 dehydrogenase of unknown specificity, short-chain alcohol dehydrogenase like [Frankia sp. EI5c]
MDDSDAAEIHEPRGIHEALESDEPCEVGETGEGGVATAVVTGGGRGIGLAVAGQLARAGLRVVIVARDPARGERACAELRRTALDAPCGTGDTRLPHGAAGPPEPRIDLVVGDLSDSAGVRTAAERLLDACPRLDVLVHNAGIWPASRVLNADGVEQAFATNHLAPFLLNHLLRDRLAATGSHVVQVTAGLYAKARIDLGRTPRGEDFHPIRTYANTKAANLALVPLFAQDWWAAGAGIRIDAVHPGVIRTGLGDRPGPLGLVLKVAKRFWTPAEAGAAPVVRLALDAGPEPGPGAGLGAGLGAGFGAGASGRYFEVEKETPLGPPVNDPDLARGLWEQALALTGVGTGPPETRLAV